MTLMEMPTLARADCTCQTRDYVTSIPALLSDTCSHNFESGKRYILTCAPISPFPPLPYTNLSSWHSCSPIVQYSGDFHHVVDIWRNWSDVLLFKLYLNLMPHFKHLYIKQNTNITKHLTSVQKTCELGKYLHLVALKNIRESIWVREILESHFRELNNFIWWLTWNRRNLLQHRNLMLSLKPLFGSSRNICTVTWPFVVTLSRCPYLKVEIFLDYSHRDIIQSW